VGIEVAERSEEEEEEEVVVVEGEQAVRPRAAQG
jgi:hypothetical protein